MENLARGGKATASTTSPHGAPVEAAIDGDPNTMWWSDHEKPGPQWLMVDLGSVRKVGGAMVAWWKAYAKDYALEVSTDGQKWREVASVKGRNNWLGDADLFRFEPVEARYVRLYCTERAVTWQAYTVFEFGVYEAVPR
jgi:chondroitin AC lyase